MMMMMMMIRTLQLMLINGEGMTSKENIKINYKQILSIVIQLPVCLMPFYCHASKI